MFWVVNVIGRGCILWKRSENCHSSQSFRKILYPVSLYLYLVMTCPYGFIRSVPNQTPDRISSLVKDYICTIFEKLSSKNKLEVIAHPGGKSWLGDGK
jgi:hypothetical protein